MRLQIIIVLCVLGASCDGFRVLFHHSSGTKSHLIQFQPIVEGLLKAGHEVTGIFFDSMKIKHENYTEIIVPNGWEKALSVLAKGSMEKGGQNLLESWRAAMYSFANFTQVIEDMALQQFSVKEFQALLGTEKKFDLLISGPFYFSGAFLADYFDCPILLFSSAGQLTFLMENTGNVIESLQPSTSAPFIEPLGFFQRLGNYWLKKFEAWGSKILMFDKITHHFQDKLGKHIRHQDDIMRDRFTVFLSASHPITHGAWSYLPNLIEIGGLHLRDPSPLPEDLKTFMDAATNGAVFISFGSGLKASEMSQEKLDIFLETFKRLDMSVIWKCDLAIPRLPKNVITKSWLPQQDLLGHSNLKVFVTHGGLGSVMEAIYHKTVLVGIPFMNDQRPNLLRAKRHGYARTLDWDSLTADELTEAINDGANSNDMRSAMESIHNIYVDRQHRPVDTAIWWIEYVCRNGGAEILQSRFAKEAPWYQYHHIDVLLFLITVSITGFSVFAFSFYVCCKCCCKKKVKIE